MYVYNYLTWITLYNQKDHRVDNLKLGLLEIKIKYIYSTLSKLIDGYVLVINPIHRSATSSSNTYVIIDNVERGRRIKGVAIHIKVNLPT